MRDRFVVLTSFTTRLEAEIVKSKLEASKIPSFIDADDMGGCYTFQLNSRGVELKVKESDFKKAKKIYKNNSL